MKPINKKIFYSYQWTLPCFLPYLHVKNLETGHHEHLEPEIFSSHKIIQISTKGVRLTLALYPNVTNFLSASANKDSSTDTGSVACLLV